jgi:hypothetical protein
MRRKEKKARMLDSLLGGESSQLDLSQLFGNLVQSLAQNKDHLNRLDEHNGDHGDNIVKIFEVAADALGKRKDVSPHEALSYAAEKIRKLPSGSAQVYAGGFENAARQFQGRTAIEPSDISPLLTTLLGLGGGGASEVQPAQQQDPLGSLLGGLLGGAAEGTADEGGADFMSSLLQGGLALLQSGEGGQDDLSAGILSLINSSPLGEVPHRQQSASMIVTGLLDSLPSILGK